METGCNSETVDLLQQDQYGSGSTVRACRTDHAVLETMCADCQVHGNWSEWVRFTVPVPSIDWCCIVRGSAPGYFTLMALYCFISGVSDLAVMMGKDKIQWQDATKKLNYLHFWTTIIHILSPLIFSRSMYGSCLKRIVNPAFFKSSITYSIPTSCLLSCSVL